MSIPIHQRCAICYITDRGALGSRPVLDAIREAIEAGVDLVQIREKDLGTRELAELAQAAVEAARGASTRIVVNDRSDVAWGSGAAGVHLGRQSIPAAVVRSVVPADFLVGVSCHSLAEAQAAEAARADYILLGPIFETPSKLRYGPPLGLETLRDVTAHVETPVLALGGISVERAGACLEAGACGIAGISIFQNAPSLARCVGELRAGMAQAGPL